jgi:hypothetical protein
MNPWTQIAALTPTPVSGDGPELYNKRGFGPTQLFSGREL